RAGYGRIEALHGVSLTVPPSSVLALLGPNGAGKSTLVRVCTGLVPASSGRVFYDGVDMTGVPAWGMGWLRLGTDIPFPGTSVDLPVLPIPRRVRRQAPAWRMARSGACIVPEGRGVFPNLSVAENLHMWTYRGGVRRSEVEELTYSRFPRL